MKKTTKTLIILLIALVLIVGGLVAVKLLNKDSAPAEETPAEEAYRVLFSLASEQVTDLSYIYQGETVSLKKENGTWILADDPDYPIDPAIIEGMLTELSEVKTYKQIDSAEDFGFESDGIDITVKGAEKHHFVLGMENPQIDKAYLLTDSSVIYTTATSLRRAFAYTAEDLLLADALPEINAAQISEMRVSGIPNGYAITLTEQQDTYYAYPYLMTNDLGTTPVDSTKVQSFLQVAAGPLLTCVDPAPDAETIAAAGFSHVSGEEDHESPAEVSFTYTAETEDGDEQTKTYRFYLGSEATDEQTGSVYRHLMMEDSQMLFRIHQNAADRILSPNPADLMPGELCKMNFSQIREFSFRLNGESHTSRREKTEDETICYLDGEEINYGYVESFFLDLVQMPAEGIYEDALPASAPILTADFVLEFSETTESYHLEIYEHNENFCIASFSGRQETLLVSTRDMDRLSESLAEMNKNAAR